MLKGPESLEFLTLANNEDAQFMQDTIGKSYQCLATTAADIIPNQELYLHM